MTYTHHRESIVELKATPEAMFSFLDDQRNLGAHMEKRSAMMMGGRMTYELDAGEGKKIGSVIRMGGSFLGLTLTVEEVITEHRPPARKAWETKGMQRMLVIDAYRMGFDIAPFAGGSRLRVFIDYRLPSGAIGRWLGSAFAGFYARWCVERMTSEASRHFAAQIRPG